MLEELLQTRAAMMTQIHGHASVKEMVQTRILMQNCKQQKRYSLVAVAEYRQSPDGEDGELSLSFGIGACQSAMLL